MEFFGGNDTGCGDGCSVGGKVFLFVLFIDVWIHLLLTPCLRGGQTLKARRYCITASLRLPCRSFNIAPSKTSSGDFTIDSVCVGTTASSSERRGDDGGGGDVVTVERVR
jgi:hypothetical protein